MDSPAARLRLDELAIYLFHGVIPEHRTSVRNYTRKHLSADEFDQVIASLKQAGIPLSMDEVLDHVRDGVPFPPNAFAVTFDDGFENNLSVAAPILIKHDVPATFYVSTAFIDDNSMSWIDRIEWALQTVGRAVLNVPWRDHAVQVEEVDEKTALLTEIRREVKIRHEIDPDQLASQIQRDLGLGDHRQGQGPLDLKLSWEQVAELDRHPLFTVGGHSHTHAILSFLPPEMLDYELDVSLSKLAAVGIGPKHYSYPEGLAHCYSDAVISAMKKRGVEISPTAEDGTNASPADPFRLKRIFV